MQSLTEFFAMGGYGGYVWPAFAIAAIVLAGLLVASLTALRRREREATALEEARAQSPRRRQPHSDIQPRSKKKPSA